MDFTVKDIKITLRRGDGKIVVIEEACEPSSPPRDAKPSSTAPKPSSKTPPKTETKAAPAKAKAEPRASKESEPPRARASKPPEPKKELRWKAHAEFGYSGMAASDGQGTFKVLKTKQGGWALFYDQTGVDSVPLGCFKKQEEGVQEGNKLHREGMPDKRRIPNVCAMDKDADEPPQGTRDEPATAPPPKPTAEAAQDAEMLKSFASASGGLLDEMMDKMERGE